MFLRRVTFFTFLNVLIIFSHAHETNLLNLRNRLININQLNLISDKSNKSFPPAILTELNEEINQTNNHDDTCPPCFNCMLPMFECKQFSKCNEFNGRCECIEGFDGLDCSQPLCGSLVGGNPKRPPRSNITDHCECDDGWSGINCNICEMDSVCDAFMPDSSLKGTCYKGGIIVNKIFEGCDVTNEKILQILGNKKPQVTFACDKNDKSCNFQFWIDQIESFYCGLDNCSFNYNLNANTTQYTCENAKCKCIPGTMLCGANGSIDIGEFLIETVKGPGKFTCDLTQGDCKFNEPSMDDLISQIFGDPEIDLHCNSGECVHYSEIPGYHSPVNRIGSTWEGKLVLSVASMGVLCLVTMTIFYISKSPLFKNGGEIKLPENDYDDTDGENFLKTKSVATLTFESINYCVDSKTDKNLKEPILNNITGMVKPGEILAIMGGSGAGKTTLLDILAMKSKMGKIEGGIKINGNLISKKIYSKIVGFVDQNDFLLPTLTVYETVLNSALLRLPRNMTLHAKKKRVYQVLEELRILDIKDRIIGNELERGISGGEKRRVSIACELVTSPLVLFLDEPTSGLDANNASNVVECLVRLAKTYNRTIILSIHQPRSNIFNLFDKLVLLSEGELIYSGETIGINEFLYNYGYKCPKNYNIADYLIDITFDNQERRFIKTNNNDIETNKKNIHIIPTIEIRPPTETNFNSSSSSSNNGVIQQEWEHFAEHRDEMRSLISNTDDNQDENNEEMRHDEINTSQLHENFKESGYFVKLLNEITMYKERQNSSSPDVIETVTFDKDNVKANFIEQLNILCSRTFKNIYRNPKLLMANYLLTILLSFLLGTLYYDVAFDISGFQNRMGLFFFILTYFGFITFTGLSSFSIERIIFIKERSNNYYSPGAYYISKIICDVLPLRLVPPIIMLLIIYPMVGLNLTNNAFLKCVIILVLFNTAISLEILSIGIIFKDLNNSIIISVLIILGSLLFSGLFINTDTISNIGFKYMKNVSIFYYSYESLLINEVKTLMLKEKKYGLNIEVPGASILSTFGFKVQDLLLDIKMLVAFNIIFIFIGYFALNLLVKEKR